MTPAYFRDLLKACGLTTRELSEHLGVARTTVTRWTSGAVAVPKYAIAYLEVYKTNLGYANRIWGRE